MNRTRKLKYLYLFGLVLYVLLSLFLYFTSYLSIIGLVALGVVPMILTRIAGYCWKNLILGRRLLDQNDFNRANECFHEFKIELNSAKYLRWLIWISPSFYTTSANALASNNIGVCNLELGQYEAAELNFRDALEYDSKYPLPFYNLAILDALSGNIESRDRNLSKSVELGFNTGSVDRVIQKSKSLYARYEPVVRDDS